MALIGEAGRKAEVRERGFGREHLFACGADAKPVDVFADAFSHAASEDTRKMNGVNASLAGQFVESEPASMFGLQFVQDASEPKRGADFRGVVRARR